MTQCAAESNEINCVGGVGVLIKTSRSPLRKKHRRSVLVPPRTAPPDSSHFHVCEGMCAVDMTEITTRRIVSHKISKRRLPAGRISTAKQAAMIKATEFFSSSTCLNAEKGVREGDQTFGNCACRKRLNKPGLDKELVRHDCRR